MSERSERVLVLVRELSGATSVSDDSSLADLGLDSLGYAELAIGLEAKLGAGLEVLDAGPDTTVGEIVSAVEADGRGPAPPLPRGIGRLQGLAELLGGRVLRWWCRMRTEGEHHVPRSGPAILAMNHEGSLDIPLAVIACPRPITFMAKKELFKNAFVSWSLRGLGGFRVDRDRFDLRAVRSALAVLGRGDMLGMYPEGTRSPGELRPFLTGAAWAALRTGAPVVPCAISGTDRTVRARGLGRPRVLLRFAPAIEVEYVQDPAERLRRAEEVTTAIREAVQERLER